MSKLFADRKIKKIEKRLLKWVKKEYPDADGKLYAYISDIEISRIDGILITLVVAIGRSEKLQFHNTYKLSISDGNTEFIVGQIVGYINACEWHGVDGNK